MSALSFLSSLLLPAEKIGEKAMKEEATIDSLLIEMSAHLKSGNRTHPPEDHQFDAVRRFWEGQEITSFRDAYLLSWSLCLPHRPNGPCVMEDQPRFQLVLDGVDFWVERPSAFRRCYQGLIKSYFTYDTFRDDAPGTARINWQVLREYLRDRNKYISDKHSNPDWVETVIDNQQLFEEKPWASYVGALLTGDTHVIDNLFEKILIDKSSWFQRELVLAQVIVATKLSDDRFKALIPLLLKLLAANEVLQDRGLISILDRYVQVHGRHLHQGLRDTAVRAWGNPWLPSNKSHWGGVISAARSMVSDWLKLEFIETFFTKLAEDGLGDRRRMEFWKRYVQSISHIEFALGSSARNSRERDMVVLRTKMTGLICELDAAGANNAFIMTMSNLVAVEFSGMGNALYGYDPQRALPFDTSRMLRLSADVDNSLKQKQESILWLSHQDGIHNWDKWEEMFEATLREKFGIEPGKGPVVSASRRTYAPASSPVLQQVAEVPPSYYSRAALNAFANVRGLRVDDKTPQGGNLWVRIEAEDPEVVKRLTEWGFHHKPGKGWWK